MIDDELAELKCGADEVDDAVVVGRAVLLEDAPKRLPKDGRYCTRIAMIPSPRARTRGLVHRSAPTLGSRPMSAAAGPNARPRLAQLSDAAWGIAALASAVELDLVGRLAQPRAAEELAEDVGIPAVLVARLLEVLVSLELVGREGPNYVVLAELASARDDRSLRLLRADLRATLLQTGDLFASARCGTLSLDGWRQTDEEILQAQGTVSAGAVDYLEGVLFPSLPGMPERLRSASAAFLDVGTGVAAVSIELCKRLPQLRAVGIEPQEAPLSLARRNVAAAGLAERIELREQSVEELRDEAAFDVAWLPGNFLPSAVLPSALATVHRALRPGGLVLMATLGGAGADIASSAARLRATLWGGDALEPESITTMLAEAGYVEINVLDRMPSMLQPLYARRP